MNSELAIIGAGVSGLTCAVLAVERGYNAKIFAAEIGPATTSAVAAAIWYPYDAEPIESIMPWSLETYEQLAQLCDEPASGVFMIELRHCTRAGRITIPDWATQLGARRLTSSQVPAAFADGFSLRVPVIDTSIHLDYLADRFRAAGGEIVPVKPLQSFSEIDRRFSMILNCTGLGAKELRPDPALAPHRGQVTLVEKFETSCAIVCDDPPLFYAIPRTTDCVIGGTNTESAEVAADPATTAQLLAEAERVFPNARLHSLGARVGLRPWRAGGVCLMREHTIDGRVLVHNYGHGGSGFTLAWGCARAALDLLEP